MGLQHINSSTRTANVGLNKIQFRAALCVGAGSRMLESVFIVLWCNWQHVAFWTLRVEVRALVGQLILKNSYMLLITGLLCLAMAGMMILVGHLMNRISHLEDLLKSMNDDLNMIAYTKKNEKQLLKG